MKGGVGCYVLYVLSSQTRKNVRSLCKVTCRTMYFPKTIGGCVTKVEVSS
jgi:hypothetical protein